MRSIVSLVFAALVVTAVPAGAQTLGPFRWQLAPYGSVLNVTVTQRGGVYELIGLKRSAAAISVCR